MARPSIEERQVIHLALTQFFFTFKVKLPPSINEMSLLKFLLKYNGIYRRISWLSQGQIFTPEEDSCRLQYQFVLCHRSEDQSFASHHVGPRSIPGQSV
jgi:hypothetical protein